MRFLLFKCKSFRFVTKFQYSYIYLYMCMFFLCIEHNYTCNIFLQHPSTAYTVSKSCFRRFSPTQLQRRKPRVTLMHNFYCLHLLLHFFWLLLWSVYNFYPAVVCVCVICLLVVFVFACGGISFSGCCCLSALSKRALQPQL